MEMVSFLGEPQVEFVFVTTKIQLSSSIKGKNELRPLCLINCSYCFRWFFQRVERKAGCGRWVRDRRFLLPRASH